MLTVEALRNEMPVDQQGPPPSAKTIAGAFSAGEGGGFDRVAVIETMLARTIADLTSTARQAAERYLQAADTVRRGGGPEAFVAAAARDARDHEPAGDELVDGCARLVQLCVAISDDEPRPTRQLRQLLREHGEVYEDVHTGYLDLFNRRLADGVSLEQLHLAIHAYLRGVHVYSPCGHRIDDNLVTETPIRLYWSHTTPSRRPTRTPCSNSGAVSTLRPERMRDGRRALRATSPHVGE